MRRKIGLIMFWMATIVIIFLIFKNVETIKDEIGHLLVRFGYPAVFIIAGLTDVLEQPIGPEIPGILAILFGLNPFIVLSLTFFGSMIGSLISLYIGKNFLTGQITNFCSKKKHVNLCNMFHKHGKWVLTIAALTPLPYVTTCWLSGAFRMRLKDFFLFGIFPRLIRLSLVLLLFFVGFML